MKCPHCEGQLPHEYVPATCPACGRKINCTQKTDDQTTGTQPKTGGFLEVLKFIGWALVVLFGGALVVLAIVFAGCVCSTMR